jgi:hypothetical protein
MWWLRSPPVVKLSRKPDILFQTSGIDLQMGGTWLGAPFLKCTAVQVVPSKSVREQAVKKLNVSKRFRPAGRNQHAQKAIAAAALCVGMAFVGSARAADLTYLQGLLDATPVGGWVKASVGKFSDAWATGAAGMPNTIHVNTGSVVYAWSSFAWDSNRGNLIIYGGGHANYIGNEIYLWQGSDGNWARGSVSSRVENIATAADPRTWLVVDDAAPQSAHTYDGNVYLPNNDMFVTLGGGIYNTGGNYQTRDANGGLVRAGPWMWDPVKADPNKVGGTTGSGYDPTSVGGNMWSNRASQWTGVEPRNYSNNTSAYRDEDGKDVLYLTAQAEYSGFPALYRYTVGDVRNGGLDKWERIGESYYAPSGTATAAIDSRHGLYVHTAAITGLSVDLGVWDLSKANSVNSNLNRDTAVELVTQEGTPFEVNVNYGMGYDEATGKLLLWDGADMGTVWETEAVVDGAGNIGSTWVVRKLASATAAQPSGSFVTGVMGKWQYVAELGAFMALNEYSAANGDAEVWLYKTSVAAAVPEPSTYLFLLTGLGLGLFQLGARRQRSA